MWATLTLRRATCNAESIPTNLGARPPRCSAQQRPAAARGYGYTMGTPPRHGPQHLTPHEAVAVSDNALPRPVALALPNLAGPAQGLGAVRRLADGCAQSSLRILIIMRFLRRESLSRIADFRTR